MPGRQRRAPCERRASCKSLFSAIDFVKDAGYRFRRLERNLGNLWARGCTHSSGGGASVFPFQRIVSEITNMGAPSRICVVGIHNLSLHPLCMTVGEKIVGSLHMAERHFTSFGSEVIIFVRRSIYDPIRTAVSNHYG